MLPLLAAIVAGGVWVNTKSVSQSKDNDPIGLKDPQATDSLLGLNAMERLDMSKPPVDTRELRARMNLDTHDSEAAFHTYHRRVQNGQGPISALKDIAAQYQIGQMNAAYNHGLWYDLAHVESQPPSVSEVDINIVGSDGAITRAQMANSYRPSGAKELGQSELPMLKRGRQYLRRYPGSTTGENYITRYQPKDAWLYQGGEQLHYRTISGAEGVHNQTTSRFYV